MVLGAMKRHVSNLVLAFAFGLLARRDLGRQRLPFRFNMNRIVQPKQSVKSVRLLTGAYLSRRTAVNATPSPMRLETVWVLVCWHDIVEGPHKSRQDLVVSPTRRGVGCTVAATFPQRPAGAK